MSQAGRNHRCSRGTASVPSLAAPAATFLSHAEIAPLKELQGPLPAPGPRPARGVLPWHSSPYLPTLGTGSLAGLVPCPGMGLDPWPSLESSPPKLPQVCPEALGANP